MKSFFRYLVLFLFIICQGRLFGLEVSLAGIFNLEPAGPGPLVYTMDFENVPDFSLTFNNWTTVDGDQHDTYGIGGYSFPHQTEAMAFLSFNPAQVTPSMASDLAIQPHGGQRFGACFSSNPPSNSDWFISPQVELGINGSFSFWVKSYNAEYGLDDYIIAVSTTDSNPSSFSSISGTQPLKTTTAWNKMTFNLSAFNNMKIYVAIHCVSNDHFLMMIDDLTIMSEASSSVTADFSADKTTVSVGEGVNFTDQSSGIPTSWKWTFPGGAPATSSQQDPSGIQYADTGSYPVTLKISNGSVSDSITRAGFIHVGYPSSMSLDFESVDDFSLSFDPWTVIDVKGGGTYGIDSVVFPHNYQPMAYICFVPSNTTPAMVTMHAHAGQKLGCCFSTIPAVPPAPAKTPNDKWLISPRIAAVNNLAAEFWVKTFDATYGYEKFNVAVSTTDRNPASFTLLNPVPESALAAWTKKGYSLSSYAGQDIYFGIQCVTNDGFIFMIDDISISSSLGTGEQDKPDRYVIYPNPVAGMLHVKYSGIVTSDLKITLISSIGESLLELVESSAGLFTIDVSNVPAGIYILRIMDGAGEINKKVSIVR